MFADSGRLVGWQGIQGLSKATGLCARAVQINLRRLERLGVVVPTISRGVVVHLRGLNPDVTYNVGSADVGGLGAATGASLMQDGVELIHRDGSMAHVLVLRASQ